FNQCTYHFISILDDYPLRQKTGEWQRQNRNVRKLFRRSALHHPGRRLYRIACVRSEEHTSELQSRENIVCRLLLEKKNPSVADPDCGCDRARTLHARYECGRSRILSLR